MSRLSLALQLADCVAQSEQLLQCFLRWQTICRAELVAAVGVSEMEGGCACRGSFAVAGGYCCSDLLTGGIPLRGICGACVTQGQELLLRRLSFRLSGA